MALIERRRNTVLVVDDKPIVREAVKLLVELGGFKVVGEAQDGMEAIRSCSVLNPDFVILDFTMPKVGGQTAAETIRLSCPETTIVAFSSSLEVQPAWADAFVPKDCVDDLIPVLRALSGEIDLSEEAALRDNGFGAGQVAARAWAR